MTHDNVLRLKETTPVTEYCIRHKDIVKMYVQHQQKSMSNNLLTLNNRKCLHTVTNEHYADLQILFTLNSERQDRLAILPRQELTLIQQAYSSWHDQKIIKFL